MTHKERLLRQIAGLQPAVDMRPDYVDVPDHPGHKLIVMHFDGWVWGERPHTFHGCPYYKVESTTKVMPQDMYDERIRAFEPKTYSWELRPAEGVALADLNEKAYPRLHPDGCGRWSNSCECIERTDFRYTVEVEVAEECIPTNGAAMLFSDKVDEYDNFKIKNGTFLGYRQERVY